MLNFATDLENIVLTPKKSKVMLQSSFVKDYLQKAKKGILGENIVVCTEPSGLFSAKAENVPTVIKVAFWHNIRIGVSYEGMIAPKNESGTEFKSEKLNGLEWVIKNVLKVNNKTGKEFASFCYRNCDKTQVETKYIVNGTPMSKAEIAAKYSSIMIGKGKQEFGLADKPTSKKQGEFGIKEEEMTNVVNYNVEQFYYIGKDSKEAQRVFNTL